ncbi:hypothetical protein [Aliiglaciecola sp. LCG003]|uniref:hypothetical protein n=1 Tax=Aliiglaciecola sp. LCG003 TaxID=3053655 RepID=UPI0025729415|nr:hypothetical protein [Aliiglaciecola sp. LCG003]WJG08592.1 hypothetical protein QR722_14780 [Aliiglaciecola sp. LCG003]
MLTTHSTSWLDADKLVMSDISLSTQQLSQALAQLSQAQNSSPIARQAAQVIVQHLAGNQIAITLPRQTQPDSAKLTKQLILEKPASLPAGLRSDAYQALIQQGQGGQPGFAVLNLYPKDQAAVGQQQLILAKLSQGQISQLLDAIQARIGPATGAKTLIVSAQITALTHNSISVSTQINGRQENLSVQLPRGSVDLQLGQQVQIQLQPKGNNWQVSLLSAGLAQRTKTSIKQIVPTSDSNTLTQKSLASSIQGQVNESLGSGKLAESKQLATASQSPANLTEKTSIQLDKGSITKLLQAESVRSQASASSNTLSIPKQALLDVLARHPQMLPTSLSEKLASLAPSVRTVTLALNQVHGGELRSQLDQPMASIKLTSEQFKQAQQLLSNPAPVTVAPKDAQSSPALSSEQKMQTADNQSVVRGGKQADPQAVLTGNTAETASVAERISQLAQLPNLQKQQLQTQIHDILRRLLPQASSPSETLIQIEKALQDTAVVKDPETKQLMQNLLQQIQQSLPQGKDTDSAHIKQLLTQPPLNLSAVQLIQPPAQQGLMGGLIALLQISLAARLTRTQPQTNEKVAQVISSILGTSSASGAAQGQRSVSDLNQMEQRHQMLKQLGQIFAQHQSNKLANAEQAIQGQESFYYVLPSGTGESRRDIELLIKRQTEPPNKQQKEASQTATWHLTMKLDVGDIGQMLTKAKLREHVLELDFYTSNDSVKTLVFDYLPLFKKRLESLGIEVAKTQCQLGKIPTHLQSRPYQIFETQA